MAEARGRESWAHTSALMALTANVNRDPKKSRQFRPRDFDPYSQRDRHKGVLEVTDMGSLKGTFVGTNKG